MAAVACSTAPRDPAAFARAVRDLLERSRSAGRPWAKRRRGSWLEERSIGRAAAVLSAALAAADAIRAMRR